MRAMMMLEIKKNMQDRGLLFWIVLLPILFTVLAIAMIATVAS